MRLRGKLLAIALSTTLVALLLAGAVLVVSAVVGLERQLVSDLRTTASILADQSTAALAFGDPRVATENLRALRAKEHVLVGCLYDSAGRLFAFYRRQGTNPEECPPVARGEGSSVGDEAAELWAPVMLEGARTGVLHLRSDRGWIDKRLRLQIVSLATSVGVALLGAVALSLWLQRLIVGPIGELAAAAGEVSSRGRYDVRAPRRTDDEVGDLVDAFNAMLSEVEARDLALRGAKADLEKANADLTAEISERRRAEEQRAVLLRREQEARREAEAANRLKDEFLATISHELRTPLNAIIGWVALLERGKRDEATLDRALEVIERNTLAQAQLVGDLLDVSRVVTGKVSLDIQDVELAPIVDAVVESLRPATENRHLRIELDVEEPAPFRADPNRLQQIVWNLLSNAVKFSPDGTRIVLRAHVRDHFLVLEVEDEGIGIRADFIDHVFERFRQQDSSTTRAHGGLGLGLAIVRHLVELHGGGVEVESEGPGLGALFRVRLPFVPARGETGGTSGAVERGRLDGVRILLVEDERDTRELYRIVLADRGAGVRAAESAAQALELVGEGPPPDILVSDIGLPGRDGYALLQEIRRLPPEAGGSVPAIALTAYVGGEHEQRALAAGFDRHLAKPIEPAQLLRAVRDVLGRT